MKLKEEKVLVTSGKKKKANVRRDTHRACLILCPRLLPISSMVNPNPSALVTLFLQRTTRSDGEAALTKRITSRQIEIFFAAVMLPGFPARVDEEGTMHDVMEPAKVADEVDVNRSESKVASLPNSP